jgi:ribosomal protein L32
VSGMPEVGARVLAPWRGHVKAAVGGMVVVATDDGLIRGCRTELIRLAETMPIDPCPKCGHMRHTHKRCETCTLLRADRRASR